MPFEAQGKPFGSQGKPFGAQGRPELQGIAAKSKGQEKAPAGGQRYKQQMHKSRPREVNRDANCTQDAFEAQGKPFGSQGKPALQGITAWHGHRA